MLLAKTPITVYNDFLDAFFNSSSSTYKLWMKTTRLIPTTNPIGPITNISIKPKIVPKITAVVEEPLSLPAIMPDAKSVISTSNPSSTSETTTNILSSLYPVYHQYVRTVAEEINPLGTIGINDDNTRPNRIAIVIYVTTSI